VNIVYLIDRICNGIIKFEYSNLEYVYKFPDSKTKLESSYLYEQNYDNLKYDDKFILKDNIKSFCIDLDIYDFELENNIEKLDKRLENLKVELYNKFYKDKRTTNLIRQRINDTKQLLSDSEEKLNFLDKISLEAYCSILQNEFLICQNLYYNNKLVFNYNDLSSIDYGFFTNISVKLSSYFLSNQEYRKIARSYQWKGIWNIKKNNQIFNKSVSEWTDEQRTLIGYSIMFDNIAQHPECPDDAIIDDDDALDGWSIVQNRKIEEEKKKKGVSSIMDKHKNAKEVFVIAESQEEVQNVFDMNTGDGLNRMNSNLGYVSQQQEPIKESQLPLVQQDLFNQMNQMSMKNKK
jgi:hypothetical protein